MKKWFYCFVVAAVATMPFGFQVDEPRKTSGTAMLFNVAPGFGVGSFIQGDKGGGASQLVFEGFGWVWMLFLRIVSQIEQAQPGWTPESGLAYGYLSMVGFTPWCIGMLAGLLFPPFHEYRYQRAKTEISIGVAPRLTASLDHAGYVLGCDVALHVPLR